MSERDAILVLVTAPNEEVGASLIRRLVEERWIACGNLIPGLRSIYRWEGAIEDSGEVLLLLKSSARLFEGLRRRVVELHPYECPEVLRVDVDGGHAPYLQWLSDSLRP